MRNFNGFAGLAGILLLLIIVTGCAPTVVYTSTPEVRIAENALFQARLEPVKQGGGFFTLMRLTLTNRSKNALEVGWNQTRYIHDGEIKGGVVFKGVRPADVKNNDIPPDLVPPGAVLTKDLAPIKLIAYAPYKSGKVAFGESGVSAGLLPVGENGILLIYRYQGQMLQQKITLKIKAKTQGK